MTVMLTCLSMRNALLSSLGLNKLPEQSHVLNHIKALRNVYAVQYINFWGSSNAVSQA